MPALAGRQLASRGIADKTTGPDHFSKKLALVLVVKQLVVTELAATTGLDRQTIRRNMAWKVLDNRYG